MLIVDTVHTQFLKTQRVRISHSEYCVGLRDQGTSNCDVQSGSMTLYVANLISQPPSYLLGILPPMQYEVDTEGVVQEKM